jgi:predicted acyltransferase
VWDPEGILSTVPAISTCLFGILTGNWLRKNIEPSTKIVWMFVFANIFMVLGIICDIWFPINKSLWTSSYVLYSGGMALHFLAMCYWLIDVKGYTWWTKPFVIYGLNAIAVFFASGIVGRLLGIITISGANGEDISLKNFLYDALFTSWLSPINASLAWALMYVIVWLGLMWILYSRKIFIKV